MAESFEFNCAPNSACASSAEAMASRRFRHSVSNSVIPVSPRGLFGCAPNLRENRAGVSGATSRGSGASAGALAVGGGASGLGRGGLREAATLLPHDEAFSWPQFLICLPFVVAVGFTLAEIGVRLIYRLSDPSVQVWPL